MSVDLRERARSVFRAEAIAAMSAPPRPGTPLSVGRTQGWLILGVIVVLVSALLGAAAIVSSPEHVDGRAVIQLDGVRYVRTSASGAIEEVVVAPGQRVAAGDLIARMDAAPARRAQQRARQEYDDAVRAMLRAPGSIEARRVVGQRAQARQRAEAEVAAAEIRAPAAGQVQAIRVRSGQTTAPGQVVCTLVGEPGPARVLALMPGNARPKLDRGASLRLVLDEHPRTTLELEVESISDGLLRPEEVVALGAGHLGPAEGVSVAVHATMPETIDDVRGEPLQIYDGMTASVEIVVRERSLLQRLLFGGSR